MNSEVLCIASYYKHQVLHHRRFSLSLLFVKIVKQVNESQPLPSPSPASNSFGVCEQFPTVQMVFIPSHSLHLSSNTVILVFYLFLSLHLC